MIDPKFELTDEMKTFRGGPVHRVRLLRDLHPKIKAGTLGGWVRSARNLSHEGQCWIADEALVVGDARITGNADVRGEAVVSGQAHVRDQASIFEQAEVTDKVLVGGNVMVRDAARVSGSAVLGGAIEVAETAEVSGDFAVEGVGKLTRRVTRRPLLLAGLFYPVSIMDEAIRIDCWSPTFDEFKNVSDRELLEIGGRDAVDFCHKYTDILLEMAGMRNNGI